MNQETINLLLQLVVIASKLAPTVISEINGIKEQSGKTADEIFADAGVKFDLVEAKALKMLADLMVPEEVK